MAPDAASTSATPIYSLEAFPAAAAWLDRSGAVREANRLWRRLLGEQAIGEPLVERLHPEDGDRLRRGLALVQAGGLSPEFRVRVAVDGGWAPCTLRARADGGIGGMGLGAGWLVHLHPCEGQGEAVVSLAAGNGALAFAHEVAVDLLQELDPQRLLARALDGLVAALPVRAAFIPVLDREERMAAVVAVAGSGLEFLRGRRVEVSGGVCGRLDELGRARFVAASDPLFIDDPLFSDGPPPEGLLLAPLHYEDRVLGGICAVPRTDRPGAGDSILLESVELLARLVCGTLQSARRFDRVRQASDHHERLLSVLPDPLWIVGPDDVVEECNSPASELMGNDCVGQAVNTVFRQGSGGEICAAIAAVQAGEALRADMRLLLDRGSRPVTALATVRPLEPRESGRVVVFARDITDLLAIEEERQHMRAATTEAARLAAVGELATGMAHEINNPLMGIINYADLARDEVPADSTLHEWLGVILSEGERIAELLRHLRALGRTDGMAVDATSLPDTMAAALSLVGHGLGRDGIDIALDLPPDLPPVQVVPHQLQQAIVALVSNARWAIGERRARGEQDGRGWIGIQAVAASEGTRRGVHLTVADNGIGIDARDLSRVFDPFFTRREGRSGLGLGLTRVRKDVAGWGGRIHAAQREEGGTVITLWMPIRKPEEP